jgi:hypothetical protein
MERLTQLTDSVVLMVVRLLHSEGAIAASLNGHVMLRSLTAERLQQYPATTKGYLTSCMLMTGVAN